MIKKIANQCATFDGKGKLTVDDLYSVIKVQVNGLLFVCNKFKVQVKGFSIKIYLNAYLIQNQ